MRKPSRRSLLAVTALAGSTLALSAVAAPATSAAGKPHPAERQTSKGVAFGTSSSARTAAPALGSVVAIPETCGAGMDRVSAGSMIDYTLTGKKLDYTVFGDLKFDGVVKQPVTMTYLTVVGDDARYFAVLPDGSGWLVSVTWPADATTPSAITTKQLSATGFAGVRQVAGADSGNLYVLTGQGGLTRYTVTADGQLSGMKVINTSRWGGVRYMTFGGTGTYKGAAVEDFVALTERGLNEYLFRADGTAVGSTLRSSSWGGMKAIVVGGCSEDPAVKRPIYGVTKTGDVYGYLDYNGGDLRGTDIYSAGLVAKRANGLVF